MIMICHPSSIPSARCCFCILFPVHWLLYHSLSLSYCHYSARQATLFVTEDIPALTSGNMVPTITIRYAPRDLDHLDPNGEGWWPSPGNTLPEKDPDFDSMIVIWDPRYVSEHRCLCPLLSPCFLLFPCSLKQLNSTLSQMYRLGTK